MDHFNATVQNGLLVHTRRGLQVSKQKFNGLSFVNSYPQTFDTGSSRKAKSSEPTLQREFKFVSRGQEQKPEGSRRQRKDADDSKAALHPGPAQGRKSKKKVAKDQMSTTSSASDCSSRHSSQTSSPVLSEGLRTPTFLNTQPLDFSPPSPLGIGSAMLPGQPQPSTPDLPTYMSAENRKLFHHYFAYVPRNIYPYVDILTYNPIKSSDCYYMVIKDLAALHCILMTGSITEMLLNHGSGSKGFEYHISKICAILNRKLGQNKGIDPVTVECILALALMGVSLTLTLPESPT